MPRRTTLPPRQRRLCVAITCGSCCLWFLLLDVRWSRASTRSPPRLCAGTRCALACAAPCRVAAHSRCLTSAHQQRRAAELLSAIPPYSSDWSRPAGTLIALLRMHLHLPLRLLRICICIGILLLPNVDGLRFHTSEPIFPAEPSRRESFMLRFALHRGMHRRRLWS